MSIAASVHQRVHRSLVFDRRRERLSRALVDQLPEPPVTILDIGSGSGEIGADLAAAGHDVIGVETHPRERFSIPTVLYDGDRLPFADGTFEWATIVDVLHHTANPRAVLAEALRVTTRGVVVKDHFAESGRQRLTLGVMDWFGNRQFGVGREGRYRSRSEWAALWERAGVAVRARDETLDLYPAALKPLFETGLHFVARLEPVADEAVVSG